MGSPVLTAASTLLCPHGGVATLPSANNRVLVEGSAILTLADAAILSGCANAQAQCARIGWIQGSSRVRAGGVPVVTQDSTALAWTANQQPGGAPIVGAAARRVLAGS